MPFFVWVLDRLKESNTWIGISAILTTVGVNVDPELWKEIASFGVSAAGLVLIVTKEQKPNA